MIYLLVDGNSLMNRAFYGLSPRQQLTAPDGTPTGALVVFFNMLFKYEERCTPDKIIVCFDRPEPTFRHQFYAGYKAGRKPMPEDLAKQMPLVKEALQLMGIAVLEQPGYEADDLIGTLSLQGENKGDRSFLLSGDRDLWQLLSERTHIFYPSTKKDQPEEITEAFFQSKYGFAPEKLVDLKALMGDASDAIPGVPGIGEKTGIQLIQKYGSLQGVYERSDQIKGAQGERLRAGRKEAELSYKLAQINRQAPLNEPLDELKFPLFQPEQLAAFFQRLGLVKLMSRFQLQTESKSPIAETENNTDKGAENPPYTLASTLEDWVRQAQPQEQVALISNPIQAQFALYSDSRVLVCLPEEALGFVWPQIGHFIDTHPSIEWVTWQGKQWMRHLQLEPFSQGFFDVELAAYLLNQLTESEDDSDRFQTVLNNTFPTEVIPANLQEGEVWFLKRGEQLLRTAQKQKILLSEQGLDQLASELEFPLEVILTEMEEKGVLVDEGARQELSHRMKQEVDDLEQKIEGLVGHSFNVNSSRQLGEVLFDQLGLKGGKKTKTGAYSTAADILESLRQEHPVVPLILQYRELTKLKSTFVDGLGKCIDSDGRVRTTFRQTLTSTGRLSSANPNLQNIPARSKRSSDIRRLFVAPPGSILVDADYSQIELRLLAVLSGDQALQKAFLSGVDIHTSTAAQLFMKPVEEVTEQERRAAKTVNFSIVYGVSDYGLARNLSVPISFARQLIDSYHGLYPMVTQWMQEQIQQGKEKGYVETWFGRRRYLPELKSSQYHQRQFGERAAMNAPVQGSAADLIKKAMIAVSSSLEVHGLQAKMILQVHDELILESSLQEAQRVGEILREGMEKAVECPIPLKVELGYGWNWSQLFPTLGEALQFRQSAEAERGR